MFSLLVLAISIASVTEDLNQRFPAPKGYQALQPAQGTFASWLKKIPLKPEGSHTYTYRSEIAATDEYTAAVVDLPVRKKDLQQCADAVIRLRAEYLWSKNLYQLISFNFTSGFRCDYKKYAEGNRYRNGKWIKSAQRDYSYKAFQDYLDLVYTYAGTISLEKQLRKCNKLEIGNVFIQGASPGHCFVIVNMCVNKTDTLFQLAQSYMPAQDIQVLKDENGSWFKLGTIPDMPYGRLIDRMFMRKFE